ncbi:hypothetical protein HNY73_007433 [Argiope bruennichi]|uniref:Uncharacterized protein n=1 Tax=Argiope bruennichi TaxID=94029 RepID=A0A8T0FJF5_ARGBR|nr:hypothetical protein HNY73_007433 [Argiope bruennichi]
MQNFGDVSMNKIQKAIESSQVPPLQPPPLPPFPFYPHRSVTPSLSMNQMMGSDAMKCKDNLLEELKPEFDRRFLECFTQGEPAACAEELMQEVQKIIAPETQNCELLYIGMI